MRSLRLVLAVEDWRAVALLSLVFIGLGALDGWLTGIALGLGSSELNPILGPSLGSHIPFKALLSASVAVVLVAYQKHRLLKPLSVGMLGVCVWNSIAILTWI